MKSPALANTDALKNLSLRGSDSDRNNLRTVITSLTKVAHNDETLPRAKLLQKSRFLVFMVFWFLVSGYFSYAEDTLTITTYYPSPHGVYKTLRLYPNNDSFPGGSCLQEGEGAISYGGNQIVLCNNAKKWQSLAGEEKYWTTTTINTGLLPPNDSFTVLYPRDNQWNVGIGFPVNADGTLDNPDFNAKLQVNGAIGGVDTEFYSTNKASLIGLSMGESVLGNFGCAPNNDDVSYAAAFGGRFAAAIGEGATAIGGGGANAGGVACLEAMVSNWARGDYSVVAGGNDNRARGNFSVVSGNSNRVAGNQSVVSGGDNNEIDSGNNFSTISGGDGNRVVSGNAATISGGRGNNIMNTGDFSTISGGRSNLARTFASVVSGGRDNIAGATYSWAGGRNMQISSGLGGNRTFAWGHSALPHTIADNDAFIIYSDATTFTAQIGNPNGPPDSTTFNIYNLLNGFGGDTLKYTPFGLGAGTIFRESSSRRWKTNIRPIENALTKVKQLRGVYFNWKESQKPGLGMIAEEVGEVIPEVVSYEANGQDARSLDYEKLVGLLVEAIKEQEQEIKSLEKDIEELEKG